MRAQDSGTVVNVASLAGRFPLDDEATYSTTKFGLRIFSFAVAEELRNTNVRICVVSPGPVETGFILDESVVDTVPPLVFSQPMSTADEIKIATLTYLVPAVRKLLVPMLERKGEREKKKYLARHSK
jgi:short-subunit dehydrogenase